VSTTVSTCVHVLALPQLSVAVHVRVITYCWPAHSPSAPCVLARYSSPRVTARFASAATAGVSGGIATCVVGWLVDSALRRGSDEPSGPGIGYTITVVVCDIVFGILASIIVMYFSRQREFRADAGAARLIGSPRPMMAALRRLGGMEAGELPQNVATAGINGRPGWMELFSSHPPIEQRIAALQRGS
jgi:Zn-dependent protease with chaperone function